MPPPTFSEVEISRERDRITKIASFLATKGAQTIAQLFDHLHENYSTIDELLQFVQRRSHIFLISSSSNAAIGNRLLEYSQAFLTLLAEMAKAPGGKLPEALFASRLSKLEILLCSNGLKTTNVDEFLREYPNLFKTVGNSIEIHKSNLEKQTAIPSHWHSACLPSLKMLDRSTSIELLAVVVDCNAEKNMVKLYIEKPDAFAKQFVSARGDETKTMDLCQRLREGTRSFKTELRALRDYSITGDHWRAQTINCQTKRNAASASNIATSTAALNQEKAKSGDSGGSNAKAASSIPAQDPIKVCNAVDLYISDTRATEIATLKSRNEKMFSSFENNAKFLKFLANRPHLFKVDGTKIFRRSERHRFVLKSLQDDMKHREYTVAQLSQRLGEFSAGFKKETYGTGEKSTEAFIADHSHIFKLGTGKSPQTQTITLQFNLYFPKINYCEQNNKPLQPEKSQTREPSPTIFSPDGGILRVIAIVDSRTSSFPSELTAIWHYCKSELSAIFPYESDFKRFICNHPHLYKVKDDGCHVMLTQRSDRHRRVLQQLAQQMSKEEFTVNKLGSRLGTIDSGFLVDVYGYSNQWIHEFIADHKAIFNVDDHRENNMEKIRLAQELVFPLATGGFNGSLSVLLRLPK